MGRASGLERHVCGHPCGRRGERTPIAPEILIALWLYATLEGVGSARAVARLTWEHDAYRWICGGVQVNDHTLADLRTAHGAALDAVLTDSVAALLAVGAVTLKRVAQDGIRIRAMRQERIEQALKRLPQLAEIKTKQSKKAETARAPAFLGRRRYRLGGCDRRRLGGGLLPRLDRGRVPGDVPNDRGPQRGADQRLMDPGSRTGGCGAYTSIAGFCPESRPTTCWKDEFRLGWFRRVRRPPPTSAILLRSSNPAQV